MQRTYLRMLGHDRPVWTLEITRERIEQASPASLACMRSVAGIELMFAEMAGCETVAYGISNVLAEIRAQERILERRQSIESGCICGLIG